MNLLKPEQFSLYHSFLNLKLLKLLFQNHYISFFCIPASNAKLAAVRPNKPRDFMTDFNNGSPVFNNGPRSLPKNRPVCLKILLEILNSFRYLSFT